MASPEENGTYGMLRFELMTEAVQDEYNRVARCKLMVRVCFSKNNNSIMDKLDHFINKKYFT